MSPLSTILAVITPKMSCVADYLTSHEINCDGYHLEQSQTLVQEEVIKENCSKSHRKNSKNEPIYKKLKLGKKMPPLRIRLLRRMLQKSFLNLISQDEGNMILSGELKIELQFFQSLHPLLTEYI